LRVLPSDDPGQALMLRNYASLLADRYRIDMRDEDLVTAKDAGRRALSLVEKDHPGRMEWLLQCSMLYTIALVPSTDDDDLSTLRGLLDEIEGLVDWEKA